MSGIATGLCRLKECGRKYLILGGAEQVVSGGVERQTGHGRVVSSHHLDAVAPGDRPHPDGAVGRGREHHRLPEGRGGGKKDVKSISPCMVRRSEKFSHTREVRGCADGRFLPGRDGR